MDHFYDNSLQTGLMRDIATDLEILGEHIVLLGNQVRQVLLILPCLSLRLSFALGCWEEQDNR